MSENKTKCPKGKVTDQQELCLQTYKEFLMGELDGRCIVDRLCSKFIFSADDKERIVGTGVSRTSKELNGLLVDTLMKRGSMGFEAFLQALDDTGHEKAFMTLNKYLGRCSSSDSQADGNDLSLTPPTVAVDHVTEESLHGRVEELTYDVNTLKNRMDDYNLKMTKVGSDNQSEMYRLRKELCDARNEVARLRKEKDDLSLLVTERSEQLEIAEKKLAELETTISRFESENQEMKMKINEQAKKISKLTAKSKKTDIQINDLENAFANQKSANQRAIERHQKEMDRRKVDMDYLHAKLDSERKQRKDMQTDFYKHMEKTNATVAQMQGAVSQKQEKGTVANSGGRRANGSVTSTKNKGAQSASTSVVAYVGNRTTVKVERKVKLPALSESKKEQREK